MSLADAALRSVITNSRIEIGLALEGVEVVADGYLRQIVPSSAWMFAETQDGLRAATTVTFGPLRASVTYDSGAVFVDEVLTTLIGVKPAPVVREAGLVVDYRAELMGTDG